MKSVLITGTSKGIGFETALAFGRAGYKVFATMRDPAGDTSLKQLIKDESLPIIIYELDVDSDDSVKHRIEAIIAEHGNIDILVNNAGMERHGSIEELDLSDIRAVMETNYFGVIRCIKAILPQMRKNKSGCIINISSVAGKIAISPLGCYSASKFALEAITEALAQEVKPYNIRVSLVEPGIIDTRMAHAITVSSKSIYPQVLRFGYLFSESLKQQTPPSAVAQCIFDIADGDTWQLKHPVGPDALPFLDWRASMTDEQWVDWNSQNDEEWFDAVETTFGMNLRKYRSVESIA
jgi:NAD(P)-dependent dehydrogenase (short-subunit alcohol dehydrogenase family)